MSDRTVLVVDDSPVVRIFTSAVLAASGYAVLTAASPAEAEEFLAAGRPPADLLLADVRAAGGLRPAKELAARVAGGRVLFAFDCGPAWPAAGGRFLRKPFRRRELLGAVKAALGGPVGELTSV